MTRDSRSNTGRQTSTKRKHRRHDNGFRTALRIAKLLAPFTPKTSGRILVAAGILAKANGFKFTPAIPAAIELTRER